ncbi:transporter substrate-binding domain-containing protein [Bradyrhizobium sp. CCBAU 21360]|uniref:transporter substrate-binding domain-containing protein n=1 Tax=Bradyrhizobium sp. CCBAU 21360 TaxID=1325081 RepID=UPI002304EE09|nr:transporter substrate-binding domain-containing protein [Bradyrhizobium sp. CCBAU 21360]MDA9445863.1 ABC transporter substrate-binding protein [Bradyrhizobium sp. CCBAU 21360]
MNHKLKTKVTAAVAFVLAAVTSAQSGPLTDRIKSGNAIRIGFASEPPFAFPGSNKKPLGFANAVALGTLKKMGYTNIESVVTDWGGMIPGLVANRLDLVTGGMYILSERCTNVAFSEPIGRFGDAFIVPKGNPKGLNDYKDIVARGAILATVVGHNTIGAAKKEGVPDANVTQLPGVTELLAAVKSGRADAGALPALSANRLASLNADTIEATNSDALPDWTFNWIGLGFRKDDADFLKEFNTALNDYLHSPEMLAAVEQFEYLPSNLPGDTKTEWVCKNR